MSRLVVFRTLAVLVIVFCPTTWAADMVPNIPPGSPFEHVRTRHGYVNHFRGRAVLTGRYAYGYREFPEEYDEPELIFIPDTTSRALLPYWGERGQLEHVTFNNPASFVRAAIPAASVKRLKARKAGSITGDAAVVVSSFEASFECDAPTYTTRFVAIRQRPAVKYAVAPLEMRAC